MWKLYAAVALVWVALSPPLFTGGRCTAEFEAVERQLLAQRQQLFTAAAAAEFLRAQGWPVSVITPERCRQAKPRFMPRCGRTTVVVAKAPVANPICSFYRDAAVEVLLEYAEQGFLVGLRTDMAPYKSLRIPFSDRFIHWGR